METAEQRQTPNSLVFGRHLGAMALASLMNPLIYYSDHPFTRWVETWATPLAISSASYAAYALFFTRRAKEAWPRSFFILAWVFLLLTIAGPFMDKLRHQRTPSVAESKSMAAEVTTTTSAAIQSTPFSDPNYGADPTHPPANNTPVAAPLPSPPPTHSQKMERHLAPKMSYSEKVKRLRGAAETGALKTIDVRSAAPNDYLINQWPSSDVYAIEAGQTWWVSEGTAWIHVANRYSSAIEVVHFYYAQGLCERPSGKGSAEYSLPLLQPISPGAQALVRFAAGHVIADGPGCLVITGIQGRPAANAPGTLNSGPNFFDQFDR